MVFRSLVLVSVLLGGCAAGSSDTGQTAGQPSTLAAVNAALAKKELVVKDGVPVLK
jgi:hypothetical protein